MGPLFAHWRIGSTGPIFAQLHIGASGAKIAQQRTGSCGPTLPKREVRPGEGRITGTFLRYATQEQMSRKATGQLNMMAKHKNAPALGQGAEESRAASGQSTEPLG